MKYHRLVADHAFGFDCELDNGVLKCALLLTRNGVDLPVQTTMYDRKVPVCDVSIDSINNHGFNQCCKVLKLHSTPEKT